MSVPSTPQDLINLIREKLFNNTSGRIDEPSIREVLEWMVKVLDAKFSLFSPELTEEQYSKWNLMLDYMVRETKGVLTTSSIAPTEKGKYLLAEPGTYTNLGGIVTTADKLNYAYFDGTTWSLIAVDAIQNINYTNSINLLENIESIQGKYIDHSNGNMINHAPHTTTDFIPLIDGVHYSFGKHFTNSFFAFYDENKNYVSDTRSQNRIFDFKLPQGARFVRLSYLTANENDVYLVAKTDVISNDWGVDILQNIKFDEGFYVSQSNGGNQEASWTAVSDFIPILPKQAFGINPNTYQQFAFYDKNLQYLTNDFSANSKKDFIAPENAYCFRMTVNIADLGVNYLKLKNPKFIDNYIEIGKRKTDFETIQSAINYANSTGKVHTINIGKGVYYEALKNFVLPHLFFGEKGKTIISDVNDSDQKWETLQVATGYFEGIYFKREGGGYAVHVDYEGTGVAEFFNCRIESAYGSAIGNGQQHNQSVKFRNCQIIQRVTEGSTGILYMHNAVNENVTGGNIEFWNCEIDGFDRIVRIDDANQIYGNDSGSVGRFKPLFVGNNFRSKNYGVQLDLRNGSKTTYAGAIIGRIVLDERSHGNNIASLNHDI